MNRPARIKICPQCGVFFPCRVGDCWCDKFPPLPLSAAPGQKCLCPECLAKTAERLQAEGRKGA